MKTRLLLAILFFLAPALVLSQGFDENYEVRYGDINGDGLTALYVRQKPQILILHGDIATPIVMPPPVKDFILQNSGSGQFSLITPNPAQRALAVGWPVAPVSFLIRDRNFDGSADLQLNGLNDLISGAYDVAIFSSSTKGAPPVQITALTPALSSFLTDAYSWSLNHEYFSQNAPWAVVGVEPPSRQYYGTVFDSNNILAINVALAQCFGQGYLCGVTSLDPSPCNWYLDQYDEFGNYVGSGPVNVCTFDTHIFVYQPGTVTLARDYSWFNQDAIQFAAKIVSEYPGGLEDLIGVNPGNAKLIALNETLKEILFRVFGSQVLGDEPKDDKPAVFFTSICDVLGNNYNHTNHASFPGDSNFNTSDPTFHHYDVSTNVCNSAQSGCSLNAFLEEIFPLFSYPSYKLRPTLTPLDGTTTRWVYGPPPFKEHDPNYYVVPGGMVTQNKIQSGNWSGAIQNITTSVHFFYPGRISRTLVGEPQAPTIFTHGIGLNKVGSIYFPGIASQPINMILGCANDMMGPEIFKTLDKQAIKYWNNSINNFSAPMMEAFGSGGAFGSVKETPE